MKGTAFRPRWRFFFLGVAALGLCSAGWYYWPPGLGDKNEYQTAKATRSDLVRTVTASGQLSPVIKVDVGSQISGIIQKLLVDFNSAVQEGQVIAQIDPASYEANFIQAEGTLAKSQAALELARLEAQRANRLREDHLIPEADYQKALADQHQAEAVVKIDEGGLKKAHVDLARCTIYAPISGVVISRNVDVGQTVAASLSAPTLFIIANDLSKMQITANVAEADIGMVDIGQQAEFKVDAFPGQKFQGSVAQIRNAPKTDQNVVTYDTILEVTNSNLKLKPGMTATVSIIVGRRENALVIPNVAMRFRPPAGLELSRVGLSLTQAGSVSAESDKKAPGASHKKNKQKLERTVYVMNSQLTSPTVHKPSRKAASVIGQVQVKTGISAGGLTEVLEGLSEGDEVVTGVTIKSSNFAAQLAGLFGGSQKKH
jgi:HlyD family secretion protein